MDNFKYNTIIIGAGLAGCNMALNLHAKGEKVLLIGHPNGDRCSSVAAGLMNPIVPKGVASTWKRDYIFSKIPSYYQSLQQLLKTEVLQQINIHQLMSNVSMRNEWQKACQKTENKAVVDQLEEDVFEIKSVYRLDVSLFLEATKRYFNELNAFVERDINHADIRCDKEIQYAEYSSDKLLFCEGHELMNNPFFNYLPLSHSSGVIGEYSLDHTFSKEHIIRRKKWCIPTKNETYLVGSTFVNNDFSVSPTAREQNEIEDDLSNWTRSFQRKKLKKGLRPIVGDRRPLLGRHHKYSNLFVYNGLGSKGCSLSALFCPMLTEYMINNGSLLPDVDIKRFKHTDYTA